MPQQHGGLGNWLSGSAVTRPFASIAGAFAVMAALLLVTAQHRNGWHLGLFVWGLGLTLAGVIYAMVSERVVLRRFPDADEDRRAAIHSRQRVSMIEITIMGLGAAIAAGGTGWVAVDAAFTAILVLAGGLSTFVGLQAIRRLGKGDG